MSGGGGNLHTHPKSSNTPNPQCTQLQTPKPQRTSSISPSFFPPRIKGAGLTVAVLEELSELDAGPSKGPGRQRLKTRVLAQVVSPGASTYLYDCCLRPDDVEFKVCLFVRDSFCVCWPPLASVGRRVDGRIDRGDGAAVLASHRGQHPTITQHQTRTHTSENKIGKPPLRGPAPRALRRVHPRGSPPGRQDAQGPCIFVLGAAGFFRKVSMFWDDP